MEPEQPALFGLREDCRPAADSRAAGPTWSRLAHADGAEGRPYRLAEQDFGRVRKIKG